MKFETEPNKALQAPQSRRCEMRDVGHQTKELEMIPGLGFCVIYRARVPPDKEAAYVAAWSRLTALLRSEHGALGSRLHRGADSIWYAYAQWPSAQARTEAFAKAPIDAVDEQTVRACITEYFPEIQLEPIEDRLVPVGEIGVPNNAMQPTCEDARA